MTTLVQHKNGEGSNVTSISITVTTTTGNSLHVVAANNSGQTVTSVTDDHSGGTNTYSQFPSAQSDRDGGTGGKADIWDSLSPGGGVTSVTINFSASVSNAFGEVFETTLQSAVRDVAGVVNGGSTGATDTGPAVTTTTTDGFVVGAIVTGNGITANPHAGNEFTAGGDIGAVTLWAACSLISTTAASHQPVWDDSAGQLFCSSVASWKVGNVIAFNLPTSDHPGASPGAGGMVGSARFVPSNWWPYTTSVSTTVALTGASATFVAGTLGVQHDNALIGASATFTPGTLGISHVQALTGQKATFTQGTLGVSHANALAGQRATFTPGVVSVALSIPLLGSKATFGAGTVTPVTGIFAALTGASASFVAGLLTPSGGDVPVTPTVSTTTIGGMAGGVTRWTIQIPRIPEPKRVIFRRNMEQQDREDIEDIAKIIRKLT